MTQVQGPTHRAAKWMRYAPKALAVVWACCWTALLVLLLFFNLGSYEGSSQPDRICLLVAEVLVALEVVCVLAVLGLVALAIARRRPAAGGAMLMAEGLSLLVPSLPLLLWLPDSVLPGLVLALVGGLALVAGVQYVANWRKSRIRAFEGWVWDDPRVVVAVPIVLGLGLGLLLTGMIMGLMLGAVCSCTECIF